MSQPRHLLFDQGQAIWYLEYLRLWSYDVSHTVPREQDGSCELLLCLPSDIRTNHGQTHAEPQPLEEAKPEPDQPAPFVAVWQSDKQSGSDDAYRIRDDHGGASQIWPFRADDASADQSEELHRSTWDLKVLSSQCIDVERFDHERRELSDRRVRNLRPSSHHKQYPCLGVSEGLPHLVGLEMAVLDTLPVGRDSLCGGDLFGVGEEICG